MGILSREIIALDGKLPHDASQLRQWITANGGKYSATINKIVTHLIISKDSWKGGSNASVAAAELGIPIVSYDWLEDSLHAKRKLSVKKYTFEMLGAQKKMKKKMKRLGEKVDSKKFTDGCQEIMKLTGSGTSVKVPRVRKPKLSKSHFFKAELTTPYVSAADDLKRRRAEREAKEAAEKAQKEAKKKELAEKRAVSQTSPSATSIALSMSSASSTPATSGPVPLSTPSTTSSTNVLSEPQAKKPSLQDRYHYYIDQSGLEYKLTLIRTNHALNNITRYKLCLLESHTLPHTYCTLIQYMPPNQGTIAAAAAATAAKNAANSPKKSSAPPPDFQTALNAFLHPTPDNAHLRQPDHSIQRNPSASTSPGPSHFAASRLTNLITPPLPSATTPYKTLLTPMNSPFTASFLTFRHAFRDLTLLSWEERFDTSHDKTLQKFRAKSMNIEPFIWNRPEPGLPIGNCVQEVGLYQAGHTAQQVPGEKYSDGYTWNKFNLPGLDIQLSLHGLIGAAIFREEREAEQRLEEGRLKEEKEEERRVRLEKEARKVAAKKIARGGMLWDSATGEIRKEESWQRNTSPGSTGMGGGRTNKVTFVDMTAGKRKRHWGYDD